VTIRRATDNAITVMTLACAVLAQARRSIRELRDAHVVEFDAQHRRARQEGLVGGSEQSPAPDGIHVLRDRRSEFELLHGRSPVTTSLELAHARALVDWMHRVRRIPWFDNAVWTPGDAMKFRLSHCPARDDALP
jgi:hypothetical protein